MKKSHRTTIPILCVLICALMLCPTGCRQQASSDNGKQTREELDSLRQSFRYFNVEGQYDSIISTARPILMKALDGQDTMTVLLTGAYTAQAFLTMESMDSVRHYMNLIGPYRKGGGKDPSLQTVLFIVEGLSHLKAELNYSLALESFTEGCKWAEAGNDPDNHIVLLANIAHIFYVRGDRHGLQYAEEAYAISRDQAVEDFPRCQAHLLMAQMLLLSDRTQEAAAYLNDARTMIEEHQFISLISICRLLYANMYQSNGDYFQAERNYQEAMRWGKYAEAGTATMIYLDYGDFLRMRGMPGKALEQYKAGLGILALLQARRKSSTAIFISVIVVIIALSLYILYIRQRRTNRLLVTQYETYMQRLLPMDKNNHTVKEEHDASDTGTQNQGSTGERELFARIEDLMRKDKIYRQKDLSLDRLAEILSTNRTYASKAINSCASQTFFNYVDMYRIREAVMILSDESEKGNVPFKYIADTVGYNSVQVFYRSFKRETGCSPGQYRDEARRLRKERGSIED